MNKGLSAQTYIKANKKRVSVLVITIALFSTMIYLVNYMLDPTYTSFQILASDQLAKQQFILPKDYSVNNLDELLEEGANRLREEEYVIDAFPARYINISLTSILGEYYADFALTTKEKLPVLLNHYDAKLIEGRIPENPGEIVIDKKLSINNNLQVNDQFKIIFTVVGIVESDYYIASGISNQANTCITILSNGEGINFSQIAKEFSFDTNVYDHIQGQKGFQENVVNSLDASKMVITLGSLLVLSICLVIVINMYYRDRHEEWCLYQSIGFSTQNIYFVTLRELLIMIGWGLLLSIFMIGIGVLIIYSLMIQPMGLLAREIIPEAIGAIFSSLLFILGICQIPLFYGIHKIKTIDILEEEV